MQDVARLAPKAQRTAARLTILPLTCCFLRASSGGRRVLLGRRSGASRAHRALSSGNAKWDGLLVFPNVTPVAKPGRVRVSSSGSYRFPFPYIRRPGNPDGTQRGQSATGIPIREVPRQTHDGPQRLRGNKGRTEEAPARRPGLPIVYGRLGFVGRSWPRVRVARHRTKSTSLERPWFQSQRREIPAAEVFLECQLYVPQSCADATQLALQCRVHGDHRRTQQ